VVISAQPKTRVESRLGIEGSGRATAERSGGPGVVIDAQPEMRGR
jgi:hypothetical protein